MICFSFNFIFLCFQVIFRKWVFINSKLEVCIFINLWW